MHHSFFHKTAIFFTTLTLSTLASADTLRQAIEYAMQQNPDVRVAATHRWTTEEQLKQQKAGFLPTLDLSAGEGLQNSNNVTASANYNGNQAKLTRSESALTLDQNLFAGFATMNEVHRLKETVKSAAYKTGGASEDTALAVTEQYLEVLRRQKIAKLAQENVAAHDNLTHMIAERTHAGVGRAADSDQAASRLALAHANYTAEKGNLIDAQSAYIRVVGKAPTGLNLPLSPKNTQLPATEAEAIATAVATHPMLKSAEADVAAARAQHETAKSTNYPKLDLVVSASRNRNLDGQPGVSNDESAMVRSTWNLFKGGQDRAHQRETAYQIQEAIDTKNRMLWQVEQNVRLSWNAWKNSRERLHDLQQHQGLAKRTISVYRDQFNLSQRTLLDLLNSENEYYQASIDYITAQYTEIYARFRVLNSMGKLMDYVGVPYPVEANVDMTSKASFSPQKASLNK